MLLPFYKEKERGSRKSWNLPGPYSQKMVTLGPSSVSGSMDSSLHSEYDGALTLTACKDRCPPAVTNIPKEGFWDLIPLGSLPPFILCGSIPPSLILSGSVPLSFILSGSIFPSLILCGSIPPPLHPLWFYSSLPYTFWLPPSFHSLWIYSSLPLLCDSIPHSLHSLWLYYIKSLSTAPEIEGEDSVVLWSVLAFQISEASQQQNFFCCCFANNDFPVHNFDDYYANSPSIPTH